MAATDLTTPANLVAWCPAAASFSSDQQARIISAVSTAIQSWCNRTFGSFNYNEAYNGTRTPRIALRNYPVTAVASVTVGGVAVPASANGSTGYVIDAFNDGLAALCYVGACWPSGFQNVQVSYTAGYATIPADIEQACLEGCAYLVNQQQRDPAVSERKAGDHAERFVNLTAVSAGAVIMTPSITSVLAQYRKVAPV